jgi:plasmid maintenance system antidote protein VapI
MARRKKPKATLSDQLRQRIADWADQSGRSLYELSRDAKVDRATLSRFLTKRRTITLETADRLAAVLGVRLTDDR